MKLAAAVTALGIAIAVPLSAWSQAPAETKEEGGLKLGIFDVSGYVDLSLNHLSNGNLFVSGTPSRVFDLQKSGGRVQQVAATLAFQPKEGFGGLLNVTLGKDADVIAPYKTDPQKGKLCNVVTGLNADGSSCNRDYFDVTQAFLQYATGSWTIIGGKFVTSAGAEVIASPANPNFSRSILFGYAIPFSHTGLRVTYAFSDALSVIGGVNQGWDDIKDTNSSKTGELGATFTPHKMVSLAAMAHFGKERVAGLTKDELSPAFQPEGQRELLDVVLTINATDKLTFILNYDTGSQKNTSTFTGVDRSRWDGLAVYANYTFNDNWKLSFRTEYFNDKNGFRTGIVQKWKENTLTVAWLPIKPVEVRAEYRRDRSNANAFLDDDGSVHNTNTSYGLQFLYKF
jgi:hypothetical protein